LFKKNVGFVIKNLEKRRGIYKLLICQGIKQKNERIDNGPEFISKEIKFWAKDNEIQIQLIQPGRPVQIG
jgi:transposase InsO family protein